MNARGRSDPIAVEMVSDHSETLTAGSKLREVPRNMRWVGSGTRGGRG